MITKYKTFVFPGTSWRILKYIHKKGVNVYKSYISVDVSRHDISQCFGKTTCIGRREYIYKKFMSKGEGFKWKLWLPGQIFKKKCFWMIDHR